MVNRKLALASLAMLPLVAVLGGQAVATPLPLPPLPPLPGLGLEVRFAPHLPPRIRHEYQPRRPFHEAVWIAGHWAWTRGGWVWVSGRWERPPYRYSRWVPPRYDPYDRGCRYEPGYWSHEREYVGDGYRHDGNVYGGGRYDRYDRYDRRRDRYEHRRDRYDRRRDRYDDRDRDRDDRHRRYDR